MLILTRRIGETLMIGDSVSVTILGIKGGQVRIGINAPKDVPVNREEVHMRLLNGADGQSASEQTRDADPRGDRGK